MSFFGRAAKFLQDILEQSAGAATPRSLFGDPGAPGNHFPAPWLAGAWSGTVAVSQVGGQSGQVPFTMRFDPEGRPMLAEYAPNNAGPISHAGQTWNAGRTRFQVRELAYMPDGVRVVITTLYESFQQHAGVWGVGYASSSEAATMTSESSWEFRREGEAVRLLMRTFSRRDSAMRVLDGGSTGHEQGEVVLTGLLQYAGG